MRKLVTLSFLLTVATVLMSACSGGADDALKRDVIRNYADGAQAMYSGR